MSDQPDPAATGDSGGLWAFARTLYQAEGAAPACLALQDEHGADVCLLLFAAWLGADGITLSPAQMSAAAGPALAWRGEVVAPLRALRRRLKAGPPPAPDAATDALRDEIGRAELAAEHIQLSALERTASSWDAPGRSEAGRRAAAHNLTLAFEVAAGRAPDPAAARLLGALAEGLR